MALGGTYSDRYKDMFKDVLLLEAQQDGSRLEQAVMIETMEGNKTFFDKLGKLTSAIKSSRNEAKVFSDLTFERRQVQEVTSDFNHAFDKEDLIKYVKNPRNEVVQTAVFELGRTKDSAIMDAISGNAVVTTNGSTSNQALTLSVAVDDHTYDSGSGDVGLTSAKLKKAMRLIQENFGDRGARRFMCIAPSKQIMNLTTEDQQVSGDFRGKKPLEGPGIVTSLSGFMGIDFISYDDDIRIDGSSDEKVYLLTDDAVKLGIFLPLTVEIAKQVDQKLNPDSLAVWEAIGATRMYEEKVVEILCDPLA